MRHFRFQLWNKRKQRGAELHMRLELVAARATESELVV